MCPLLCAVGRLDRKQRAIVCEEMAAILAKAKEGDYVPAVDLVEVIESVCSL